MNGRNQISGTLGAIGVFFLIVTVFIGALVLGEVFYEWGGLAGVVVYLASWGVLSLVAGYLVFDEKDAS